jgi:hypothetical protein
MQLQSVATGHRHARERMEALVRTEFGEQFLPNIFCTACCILFSSNCCTNHAGAHHHQGSLIHLVRHENLILTPMQDLVGFPEDWTADIQVTQTALIVPVFIFCVLSKKCVSFDIISKKVSF